MKVRVQNLRGHWLKPDRTWTPWRQEAMVFSSIAEAELELERWQIGWMGQVMFDVGD